MTKLLFVFAIAIATMLNINTININAEDTQDSPVVIDLERSEKRKVEVPTGSVITDESGDWTISVSIEEENGITYLVLDGSVDYMGGSHKEFKIGDTKYEVNTLLRIDVISRDVTLENNIKIISNASQKFSSTDYVMQFLNNSLAIAGYNATGYDVQYPSDEHGTYYEYTIDFKKAATDVTVGEYEMISTPLEGDTYAIRNIYLNGQRLAPQQGIDFFGVSAAPMMINGNQVWCIEPQVATTTGAKYDSEPAEENIRAALISVFANSDNTMNHVLNQLMIWQAIGYEVSVDDLLVLDSFNVESNASQEAINAMKQYQAELLAKIAAYDQLANFDTTSIHVSRDTDEIVIHAGNSDVLKYYAEGNITYPNGVTGVVDVENGTITLTIDYDVIEDASEITLSMIPAGTPTETIRYYNQTGTLQELKQFGIANPKYESIKIVKDPEYTITGNKTFVGRDLTDGEFTFELKDENGTVIQTTTNKADGTFKFETIGYDAEGTYKYTVSEVNDNQKDVTYDATVYDVTVVVTRNENDVLVITSVMPTITFQNEYIETIDLQVNKIWEDNENKDGYRPTSITVKLYADGEETGQTVVLSDNNDWAAEFTNLIKKKDGNDIVYTVEEIEVNKYTAKVTGDMTTGYTITNTLEPEKPNVPDTSDDDPKKPSDEQPKKPNTPDTSDSTNTSAWAGLFGSLSVLTGAVWFVFKNRKRNA